MENFQTEETFWRLCIEALRKKDYATNKKYCGSKSSYRVVQLNFTPEIEVF